MKLRIIFLFSICTLLTYSCDQKKEKSEKKKIAYEYYPNGNVMTETEVKDSLAHGIMKLYTKDGKIDKVFTYNMGKREGPAVDYYYNGQLRTKCNYKDNKLSGLAKLYYKTGELYRETVYNEGKVTGIRKCYYKNGSLMSEAPYLNGFPGIGLKEYNDAGEEVQVTPKIMVKEINYLAFTNDFILELSLSPAQSHPQFYVGELTDGKYLNIKCWNVKMDGNKGRYSIRLGKGNFIMKTIIISAEYTTKMNNVGVVSRKYNLAISNK